MQVFFWEAEGDVQLNNFYLETIKRERRSGSKIGQRILSARYLNSQKNKTFPIKKENKFF